jgi:hypothetical protein
MLTRIRRFDVKLAGNEKDRWIFAAPLIPLALEASKTFVMIKNRNTK